MRLRILAAVLFIAIMTLTTACSEGGGEVSAQHFPTWISTGTGYFEYTFDCIEGKKFMFVRYDYRSLGVVGPFGDCLKSLELTHESLPEGW